MLNLTRRLAFASLACLLAAPALADQPTLDSAQSVVDSLDQTLLGVMKQAKQLGYDGRYAKLEPAIQRAFNVPLMTRIVVGSRWTDWTDAQRDQVIKAFGRFITATYARRFDGYGGEDFVITGERPSAAGGTLVTTQLVRKVDPPVDLNYLMRNNDSGQPQVVDVFLTGTISELATRRSEFGAVLERDGFNGLLAVLAKKSDGKIEN